MSVESNNVPAHWRKGALLDVTRFTDGAYRIILYGETYDPADPIPCLEFDNSVDCQNFVSAWYLPERGPMQ